jgi:sulfatase modifying factor 1
VTTAAPPVAPPGMAWIPGGAFRMGSEDFYPEERPVREAVVEGFWIDEHPVTVAGFRRFAKATGYVTVAERPLEQALYPEADPAQLTPGSLVFRPTRGPVPLDDYRAWWEFVPGACWRWPEGAGSDTYTRARHPVVHIAHEDALAYARWAGRALPTEAEWERAARGGLDGATFAWGDDPLPGGRHMANTWQGEFPWQDLRHDGFAGTSPVGAFPANGYGLSDVCGNVWEWTADDYPVEHAHGACCAPAPEDRFPRMVIKGGSHLCAPSYCLRYRPAARQAQAVESSTSHLGFRCVLRAA